MLWSAFLIGLMGSYHCIGMCGPIALVLPVFRGKDQLISRLLYNSGRTVTYALMGAAAGVIGYGAVMAGIQQKLSVIVGFLILLVLIFPSISQRIAFLSPLHRFQTNLKSSFAAQIRKRSFYSVFLVGVINGFLPCGLVYLAIAGAVTMGSAAQGALYMILFGLGVFPVMLVFSLSGGAIGIEARKKIARIAPYFIALMAILLILRGMNLGVPYVSPRLPADGSPAMNCH